MRGNLPRSPLRVYTKGSIPAGAGEPTRAAATSHSGRVYPRGCGGTKVKSLMRRVQHGLSARVRGNPQENPVRPIMPRSIPAGAGEPRSCYASTYQAMVYPRGCGGTPLPFWAVTEERGLSPRVRGNRIGWLGMETRGRSIPAGAGEPENSSRWIPPLRVYPRGCGGTFGIFASPTGGKGLSPRVRGNRIKYSENGTWGGSIPAGAGEPLIRKWTIESLRVYPRGCGGTLTTGEIPLLPFGLSPRVRGNPSIIPAEVCQDRSIPAGAGEPSLSLFPVPADAVYPRGCGGTTTATARRLLNQGLSPRVRGNPESIPRSVGAYRSIPAGAGEPQRRLKNGNQPRVYPRGCGGTRRCTKPPRWTRGLSPRVRGNQRRGQCRRAESGSIPAGAGEPHTSAGMIAA